MVVHGTAKVDNCVRDILAMVGMGFHFFLGPVLFASASASVCLQGVSLCVSIMQVLQSQHNCPSCWVYNVLSWLKSD
jgi:hypothetical protein